MAQFLTAAKAGGALLQKAKTAKDILDAFELPARMIRKAEAAAHTGVTTLAKAKGALGEPQRQRVRM